MIGEARSVGVLILVTGIAMLLGCSGASDVGDQKASPPVAWAKALNHPFARSSDGSISLEVRSGAEVFLSGAESRGGDLPVLRYQWAPANPAAESVRLLTRSASTISFSAPQASQAQELRFMLTVFDSNGDSATTLASITVRPYRDIDAFLQYGEGATFELVPVTSVPAQLNAPVDFTIKVSRKLTYRAMDGGLYTIPEPGYAHAADFEQTLSGTWTADLGTGGSDGQCGDRSRNPTFTLRVPPVDFDDVLSTLSSSPADQQRAPDLTKYDDVQLQLVVTISAPTFAVHNQTPAASLGVCWVSAESAGAQTSTKRRIATSSFKTDACYDGSACVLDAEVLLGPANDAWDTRKSAAAYYDTIAPGESKKTFKGWLVATGFAVEGGPFDWQTLASRSTAHAVYLNNFDLGFGRDMYVRVRDCPGKSDAEIRDMFRPENIGSFVGECDIAAFVVNYPSLEAAAKKTGAVLVVAMEYAATPFSNGRRITTFYTFAPDRDGQFQRVPSANLDGRGERYMPQACTVCHGGTPFGRESVDQASGGDVHSAFMAWDLDSFLYSDTDPAFSNATDPEFEPADQRLASELTRDKQEPAFKTLNQLAFLTYADTDGRFDVASELVKGWYADPTSEAGEIFGLSEFHSSFVPPSWQDDHVEDGVPNPAGAADLYQTVYARHCRACHVMQESPSLKFDSYRAFVSKSTLPDVLERGYMPFARLTMDRFWVGKQGSESAASQLRTHLESATPPATFADAGTTKIELEGLGEVLEPDTPYDVSLKSTSQFVSAPVTWTLGAGTPAGAILQKLTDSRARLTGVSGKGTYTVRATDSAGTSNTVAAPRKDEPMSLQAPTGTVPATLGASKVVPVSWEGGEGPFAISNVQSSNNAVVEPVSVQMGADRTASITLDPKTFGTVQVSFDLYDRDGAVDARHHVFTVETSKSLTLQPQDAYSETYRRLNGSSGLLALANGSALNLLATVSPAVTATEPVTIELLTAGATLAPAPGAVQVRYTPPAAYMTQHVEDSKSPVRMVPLGSRPTIRYRVCYSFYLVDGKCPTNDIERTKEAEFAVEVVGRGLGQPTTPAEKSANSASWSLVLQGVNGSASLDTSCGGCHSGVVVAGDVDPNWMGPSDQPVDIFDSVCGWQADGTPATTGANQYIVKPGNANGSNLYQKPQGNWQHKSTTTSNIYGDANLWQAISNWIDDGAYYTTATRATPSSQKCPERP